MSTEHYHRDVNEYRDDDHAAGVAPAQEAAVSRSEQYVHDPYANRLLAIDKAIQIIYYVFGVIATLIGIRFVLELLGANPANALVQFIYALSGLFVSPFQGIFAEPAAGGLVLDLNALLAIVIYLLIAWGLARLVELAFHRTRADTGISQVTYRQRSRH